MTTPHEIKENLLGLARGEGLAALGVASARPLKADAERLRSWVSEGRHAGMEWLARSVEVRADPGCLLPGARSVVMAALAYPRAPSGGIARYALSADYHLVLRERLERLTAPLRLSGHACRLFTDAEPVLERAWAREAGLGFIGWNRCLIHPVHGSWISLGGFLTTLELPPDAPLPDGCGDCRRCVDACPAGALDSARGVDARRCLSYWTVERRDALPREILERLGERLFGCDACQEVCPRNQNTPVEGAAGAHSVLSALTLEQVLAIRTNGEYERLFAGTALARTGRKGLLRNAILLAARQRRDDLRERVERIAADPAEAPVLRETARQALESWM